MTRDKLDAARGARSGRARAAAAGKLTPAVRGAVLDAVTVIAVLDPTNAHHDAARQALRPLAGIPKMIHPINLAEVLVRPVQRGMVNETQDVLRRAGIGTFTPGTGEPLALARARALTGLKLPDGCAYITAKGLGLPLVTFDRRLTIAARADGVEVLGAPPEWRS